MKGGVCTHSSFSLDFWAFGTGYPNSCWGGQLGAVFFTDPKTETLLHSAGVAGKAAVQFFPVLGFVFLGWAWGAAAEKHHPCHDTSALFQMHMEEPCFDFLRTKQTLGWVQVYAFDVPQFCYLEAPSLQWLIPALLQWEQKRVTH